MLQQFTGKRKSNTAVLKRGNKLAETIGQLYIIASRSYSKWSVWPFAKWYIIKSKMAQVLSIWLKFAYATSQVHI